MVFAFPYPAKTRFPQINQFATTYFRGLNYLLNEEPDKAIEVFLKIAEVDRDTVETHLALGNLFRRRGEVDRAIRFHQNLVTRQGLNPEQRTQALLELGEDYMRAGLLDRAERLFSELTQMDDVRPSALRHLIAIYQQEKDWTKSIEHAKRLQKIASDDMHPVIAQFYCEIAESSIEAGSVQRAGEFLARALSSDPNCVRASIIEGRLAASAGDHDKAIRAFQRVGQQDLDYIPDILDSILGCYQEIGAVAEAKAFLSDVIERYRGISPVIALAELIQATEDRKAAAEFISAQLRRRPSVRGLAHLIGINLSDSTGNARDNLLILQDLTSKLMEGKPVYRCNQCGFGTRSLHWQCPSCKSWNSVKPIHGVAGE